MPLWVRTTIFFYFSTALHCIALHECMYVCMSLPLHSTLGRWIVKSPTCRSIIDLHSLTARCISAIYLISRPHSEPRECAHPMRFTFVLKTWANFSQQKPRRLKCVFVHKEIPTPGHLEIYTGCRFQVADEDLRKILENRYALRVITSHVSKSYR